MPKAIIQLSPYTIRFRFSVVFPNHTVDVHVPVLGLLWASLVALSKLSDGVIIAANLVSE